MSTASWRLDHLPSRCRSLTRLREQKLLHRLMELALASPRRVLEAIQEVDAFCEAETERIVRR